MSHICLLLWFPCLWFTRTIGTSILEVIPDYTMKLKYFCFFCCVLGIMSVKIFVSSLIIMPRHPGMRRRRRWLACRTERRKVHPVKAFEVLGDPSACLRLMLNLFLKCIKCLSAKFRPDRISHSLQRHAQCNFPTLSVFTWEGLDPARLEPCGAGIDRSFSARFC